MIQSGKGRIGPHFEPYQALLSPTPRRQRFCLTLPSGKRLKGAAERQRSRGDSRPRAFRNLNPRSKACLKRIAIQRSVIDKGMHDEDLQINDPADVTVKIGDTDCGWQIGVSHGENSIGLVRQPNGARAERAVNARSATSFSRSRF